MVNAIKVWWSGLLSWDECCAFILQAAMQQSIGIGINLLLWSDGEERRIGRQKFLGLMELQSRPLCSVNVFFSSSELCSDSIDPWIMHLNAQVFFFPRPVKHRLKTTVLNAMLLCICTNKELHLVRPCQPFSIEKDTTKSIDTHLVDLLCAFLWRIQRI